MATAAVSQAVFAAESALALVSAAVLAAAAAAAAADAAAIALGGFHYALKVVTGAEEAARAAIEQNLQAQAEKAAAEASTKSQVIAEPSAVETNEDQALVQREVFDNPASAAASAAEFAVAAVGDIDSLIKIVNALVAKEDERMEKTSHAMYAVAQAAAQAGAKSVLKAPVKAPMKAPMKAPVKAPVKALVKAPVKAVVTTGGSSASAPTGRVAIEYSSHRVQWSQSTVATEC
jgi:hypothetical protein